MASSLSPQDIASLITAISTVVYTIGTFLLWLATKKTLELTKRQVNQSEKHLKGQVSNELSQNYRNLFSLICSNDKIINIIARESSESEDVFIKQYIASIFINQAAQNFIQYKYGNLDPDLWGGTKKDIEYLLEWPFVRQRWKEVKKFHDNAFQELIESILKKN